MKVPNRDKIMLQKAPFDSAAVEIARTEQRYDGFDWSEQSSTAVLTEYDANRHWRRSFVMDLDHPQEKPRLLWDLSTDERYKNPGFPVYRQLANGQWVVRQDAESIYLSGFGSSPDGDRPFLDRLNLTTLESKRLFRSDKMCYERFLFFIGSDTSTTVLQNVIDSFHERQLCGARRTTETPCGLSRRPGASRRAC